MSFSVCETIYHEDEVDDDVANCVTEMICIDPLDEDCEEEEKIPRQSCTVDQETNKKYTKDTECRKEPREVCGPESCPLVQGEKECETQTKTVSKSFNTDNATYIHTGYLPSSFHQLKHMIQ